jgi:tetratricopeptide (TPR) repeat protein
MKQILIILSLAFFFAACNNEKKEDQAAPAEVSVTEKQIKDAIAKHPDSLLLTEKLIQYYRDNGTFEQAMAVTNEALQKDSLRARLWDIKATLYFENDDTVNAIRSFETAIRISPLPDYIMSLGSLYAQTKNKKALDMADALMNDKNANAAREAFFIKGLYYNYVGDKIQAISFFDRCLSMDYNYKFAYREKAIALYDLGKFDEALKVLDKGITLQNNFDEGYYWRGRCLEKLNRPAEAIEEYQTALMYNPDFPEVKQALARLGVK